jgi:hypothetical protein
MSSFQVLNSKFSNLSDAHCQVPQANTCKLISFQVHIDKYPSLLVQIGKFLGVHDHVFRSTMPTLQVHIAKST